MAAITAKQSNFIAALIRECGYASEIEAIDAYGLGLRTARDLDASEASELIDWLKAGGKAAVKTIQPLDVGSPFTCSQGTGKIITRLSDDRFLVKFDDGRSGFLTASEFAPKTGTESSHTIDTSDIPEADEAFFKSAKVKVPLGFTETEIESTVLVDTCSGLQAHLENLAAECDDFLDTEYVVLLIAETLTDGSVKRSVRIKQRL